MQARLTTALAEAETLLATNRKLIKEEAEARTAAERARYEAAAATASCEHAVQDRQLLEERLAVVQQRATEADAAREQSAKQLRVRSVLYPHIPLPFPSILIPRIANPGQCQLDCDNRAEANCKGHAAGPLIVVALCILTLAQRQPPCMCWLHPAATCTAVAAT